MWNEINPLTCRSAFHTRSVFHARSAFHKSHKGFISLKKALANCKCFFLAPPAGLEPATSWLTVMRSANWAKEEYIKGYISYPMCRLWPIFPGRLQPSIFGTAKLNFRVQNGNGWTLCVKITDSCVSVDLSSRAVSSQVFSALQSLTSVFGMGTGGPFALKTLTYELYVHRKPNKDYWKQKLNSRN